MVPAEFVRKACADVTKGGRAHDATNGLVTNVARITASVRTAPVSALKDGMVDTAHFVSLTISTEYYIPTCTLVNDFN